MNKYKTLDELASELWSSIESDTDNPVSTYVNTFSGKPKGLISKYQRCPKLKVETYSKTEPIWSGTITFDGSARPLSEIIDQMIVLASQ